jgi:hypothetical protein
MVFLIEYLSTVGIGSYSLILALQFAGASREGADPLRPHPCDDDRRLAVAVA